jgi:ribose transport system permease protein
VGIAAAIVFGALSGLTSGVLIAKLRIPPFITTLGMMMALKGLALVISGTKPIYFNDTEGFTAISQDSLIGTLVPAVPIPNAVLILFLVAALASVCSTAPCSGATPSLGNETLRLSGST